MTLRIAVKRPRITLQHLKRLLPFGKSIAITRSSKRYIERTGWHQTFWTIPRGWHGYFRTRFGSYKGRIIASTPPQFYVYKPPKGLKERHVHKFCFASLKDDGWYLVHFRIPPTDLDSGVIELERILYEAYLLTDKTF